MNLLHLAAAWREKAARIREQFRNDKRTADAAMHAAQALETCAEDLEFVARDIPAGKNPP